MCGARAGGEGAVLVLERKAKGLTEKKQSAIRIMMTTRSVAFAVLLSLLAL
jgi:hypothetical protein